MWVDTYGRGGLGWGYIFIQGYLVKFGHKVTVIASLPVLLCLDIIIGCPTSLFLVWEQITFSLAKSHIKVSLESVEEDDGEDEALTARQLHWPTGSSALHLQTAVL